MIIHLTTEFYDESLIFYSNNSQLRLEYVFFLLEIIKNKYKAYE